MYRLTIIHEETVVTSEPNPNAEPGKRVRRRKPVTRTALQMDLSDEEYKAARVALIEALK